MTSVSVSRVPQVLIVEDDPRIRSLMMRSLTDRDYAVTSATTGMSGLASAVESRPDIVLLDLGLPDVDGLEVLAMLRAVSQVPVIVTTARDDDPSVVRALDLGADDYVVKPFSADQLEARVRAVLRRSGPAAVTPGHVTVGGLALDVRSREASLDGQRLDLSPKEFEVLAYLADRPGQVVTRRELLTEVWQLPYGGPDKTVDVHLSWLRRKLGETAQEPRYLHTVRGVGVKLMAPSP
jgi:DNA-binding response OmpR family regulator